MIKIFIPFSVSFCGNGSIFPKTLLQSAKRSLLFGIPFWLAAIPFCATGAATTAIAAFAPFHHNHDNRNHQYRQYSQHNPVCRAHLPLSFSVFTLVTELLSRSTICRFDRLPLRPHMPHRSDKPQSKWLCGKNRVPAWLLQTPQYKAYTEL